MRVNLMAVGMSVVCFSVVFFPAVYYDERHIAIGEKAKLPKESLDKTLFTNYLEEIGKSDASRSDLFRDSPL